MSRSGTLITDTRQSAASLTLTAVYDQQESHNAFSYAGKTEPPLIRVSPGETIQVRYVNNLPTHSNEKCALALCENMTNLHFHGLHVSPKSPQDDVLTMMAMPGQVLNYRVDVPFDAPPGLYWYHTHPYGESARQDLDGMSGAIVIEGIDRYYPELRDMPERVLILRDRAVEDGDDRKKIQGQLEIPPDRCGTLTEQHLERVLTEHEHKVSSLSGPAIRKNFSSRQLETIKAHVPDFIVVFSEDKNGFDINGKKFAMDSAPMLRAPVGSMQHWRVVNATQGVHPLHIHQVHFLAYAINGVASEMPVWLDTVNVPYGGTVDLIMDFTDPVIRGMSVFHCHLLSHEDKGMMAKIVFE